MNWLPDKIHHRPIYFSRLSTAEFPQHLVRTAATFGSLPVLLVGPLQWHAVENAYPLPKATVSGL